MKYPVCLMWIWRDNQWKLAYEVGATWQEVQIQPSGAVVAAASSIAGPACAMLAAPPAAPPTYVVPAAATPAPATAAPAN